MAVADCSRSSRASMPMSRMVASSSRCLRLARRAEEKRRGGGDEVKGCAHAYGTRIRLQAGEPFQPMPRSTPNAHRILYYWASCKPLESPHRMVASSALMGVFGGSSSGVARAMWRGIVRVKRTTEACRAALLLQLPVTLLRVQ